VDAECLPLLNQLGSQRRTRIEYTLGGGHFDFLAGVLFNEDYSVMRAALIPHAVTTQRASFVKRTNSHRFLLRDEVWDTQGVMDVTEKLHAFRL
jgi:hypothetical protein